jgi:hypothetical protein
MVRLMVRNCAGQQLGERRLDLDRSYLRAGLQQAQGERPQPGAHLQHDIGRSHPCQPDDPTHSVGVHDEVLSTAFRRPQPGLRGQLTQRVGAEQRGG